MPNFQVLECMVALGGDEQQIVHRGHDSPVTFPEMVILQYLHGDESVTEAFDIGADERDNTDEVDRLRRVYGARPVLDCFPGTKPKLPLRDARIKARVIAHQPKRTPAPTREDPFADEPPIETEAHQHEVLEPDLFSDPIPDLAPVPVKKVGPRGRRAEMPQSAGADLDSLRAGE